MKCATPYCRNPRRTISGGRPHGTRCAKCHSRWYANRHPLRYSFNNLRNRARQRGHEFKLTLEDYLAIIIGTGYAEEKGRHGHNLSLDRINSAVGYEVGNLRVITVSENCRRRFAPLPGWMRAQEEEALRACA